MGVMLDGVCGSKNFHLKRRGEIGDDRWLLGVERTIGGWEGGRGLTPVGLSREHVSKWWYDGYGIGHTKPAGLLR